MTHPFDKWVGHETDCVSRLGQAHLEIVLDGKASDEAVRRWLRAAFDAGLDAAAAALKAELAVQKRREETPTWQAAKVAHARGARACLDHRAIPAVLALKEKPHG